MKKITHILFALVLLVLFTQCNDEKKQKTNNQQQNAENVAQLSKNFTAKINNSTFTTSKAFYEIMDDKMLITAIADDYSKIFLTLKSNKPDTYELDSSSYFTNDDGTFYINSGKLTFQKDANGLIAGTFNFSAADFSDKSKTISASDGKFESIYEEKNLSNATKFNSTEQINLDADAGKIISEKNSIEININEQAVVFAYKNDVQKSFSVPINKANKNATASIFYSSSPKYDYIFVDNIKSSVTLFFKNGNTITFK